MYFLFSFISLLLAIISIIFSVENYQVDNKGVAVFDFICGCVCLVVFYICVAYDFVIPYLEMVGAI